MIAATDRLRGLRILVVEDEGPVAMLIEDMLEEMGCTVAGSAASVGEALELIGRGGFDFALLDVNLAGEKVDPAAELLMRRGVPFAFATGYGAGGISQELRDRPVVQKPFSAPELAALVRRALG